MAETATMERRKAGVFGSNPAKAEEFATLQKVIKKLLLISPPKNISERYKVIFSEGFATDLLNELSVLSNKESTFRDLEAGRALVIENIENEEWVINNNKYLLGVKLLKQAIASSNTDIGCARNVTDVLPNIKVNDAPLASQILKMHINPQEIPLLNELVHLLKNKDMIGIIRHIEMYIGYYKQKATQNEDPELSENIKALVDYYEQLKKQKAWFMLDYLYKKLSSFSSWTGVNSQLDNYIRETNQFIESLSQYYKEDRLAGKFKENSKVKQLIHFKDEIGYFRFLLRQVVVGESQPDWKLFIEGFYKHLKDEEAHVLNTFGDVRYFRWLIDIQKKYHEAPEIWKSVIRRIIKELSLPERLSKVIAEAKDAIVSIISEELDGIKKKIGQDLEKRMGPLRRVIELRLRNLRNAKERYTRLADGRAKVILRFIKGEVSDLSKNEKKEFVLRVEEVKRRKDAIFIRIEPIFERLVVIGEGIYAQARYAGSMARGIIVENPLGSVQYALNAQIGIRNWEILSHNESGLANAALEEMLTLGKRMDELSRAYNGLISIEHKFIDSLLSIGFLIHTKGGA